MEKGLMRSEGVEGDLCVARFEDMVVDAMISRLMGSVTPKSWRVRRTLLKMPKNCIDGAGLLLSFRVG